MDTMLKWWAIFCSLVLGLVVIGVNGLFQTLWIVDLSHLSFLTLGIFSLMTTFVGYLSYKIHIVKDIVYTKYIPSCWYASELLMGCGMAGTLIGFMMMFQSNIASIDVANVESVKTVVLHLSRGLTTAVTTTLVGLVTSLLLKLQLINLEVNLVETDEK